MGGIVKISYWTCFGSFLIVLINSRPQPLNGYYLGALIFNSLYLLITFFVLDKSRFSRLTRDLLHALFQLTGFRNSFTR